MCSLIILRRPDEGRWPLLLAANRDELRGRPWRAPARHWPDRPEVIAGLDELAGGSWLGLNDYGLVAAVLNRTGSLGPAAGKRSRGELVLDALEHPDARAAAAALSELDPNAYRGFNLIVADAHEAYWLRNAVALPSFGFRTASGTWREVEPLRMPGAYGEVPRAAPTIDCQPVPQGLSMITARDLNDLTAPRIRRFLPLFRAAAAPVPEVDDWSAWIDLLAARQGPDQDPTDAMTIVTEGDYGTLCSTLIGVPAAGRPIMKFAAGRPGEVPFEPVETTPFLARR